MNFLTIGSRMNVALSRVVRFFKMQSAFLRNLILVLVGCVFLTSCGLGDITAGELYEYCSFAVHISIEKRNSDQEIAANRCIAFVDKVFRKLGYAQVIYDQDRYYVGDKTFTPEDPALRQVLDDCPPFIPQIRPGPYYIFTSYWDEKGMSLLTKYFSSAEWAVKSALTSLYPKCPSTIVATGVDVKQ